MENGFELDFPGDDDNADADWLSRAFTDAKRGYEALPENARPVVVPPIGEPDAASIDEMPRVITIPSELRRVEEWEPTTTTLEKGTGVSHRLLFTTRTGHGTYTKTVRLTKSELVEAWLEIARFVTHELD